MKAKATVGAGASGDMTSAASVTWLQPPVRLLPIHRGPMVVGTAPPLRRSQQRQWVLLAEQRGTQQPEGQA